MASQWIRWNNTSHIFEYSTDNGSSFAPLPLNAAIINEGTIPIGALPANVALKDGNNAFTGATPVSLESTTPVLQFKETDAAVDQKYWQMYANGAVLYVLAPNDALSGGSFLYSLDRSANLALGPTTNLGSITLGQNSQTNAKFRTRQIGTPNQYEWGHQNPAGYGCALGAQIADGLPFIALNSEGGTNNNTYRTRGVVGSLIRSDAAGGFIFSKIASANADNQNPTNTFTLDSSGAGTFGNFVRASAGIYERGRSYAMGELFNVAYAAANYTASGGMVWTVDPGDQIMYGFALYGKTVTCFFYIAPTTIGGTPSNQLFIALPPGFVVSGYYFNLCFLLDGGVNQTAVIAASQGETRLTITKFGAPNFVAGVNSNYLQGQITFCIQ